MNKALLTALETAFGLIALLVVIGVIFTMVTGAKTKAEQSSTEMEGVMEAAQQAKYTDIDGTTVKGSKVISYISLYSNDNICIEVANLSGTVSDYNFTSSALDTPSTLTIKDTKIKTSPNYINPNGNFLVSLEKRDADSEIVKIIFTQQ